MSAFHGMYHWLWARTWSELGVLFDWPWARERGVAHIEVWVVLTFGAETTKRFNLHVLSAKHPRVCR